MKAASFRITRAFAFLGGLALAAPLVSHAADADDASARLASIQRQRAQVAALRRHLESRLGPLGRTLKRLDRERVAAKKELLQAEKALKEADIRFGVLKVRERRLSQRLERLQRRMMNEAVVAYRRTGSPSPWLEALFGTDVATIPHRRFLLASLMHVQADLRHQYVRALADLQEVETQIKQQRSRLVILQRQNLQKQARLVARERAKRALWNRIRADVRLQRQRERELAREEAALRRLLSGLGSTLSSTDVAARWVSMRRLKGRLSWPLRGRIVVSFGRRPGIGRARLAGVELAPNRGSRQVKAVAPGQVRYADWFGGFGLMMIVDHGDGLMTVYAHNDALYKHVGDWVGAGDVLADAGDTGWVENVRLYFEIRDRGNAVNPVRWCRRWPGAMP